MKNANKKAALAAGIVLGLSLPSIGAAPVFDKAWGLKPGVKSETGEISPDGSIAAIHLSPNLNKGEIHFRKTSSGDLVKKFTFVENCNTFKCYEVESMTWTRDGKYLAAAGNEAIKIYRYATGEVVYTAKANQADGMRADPAGRFIAIGNGKQVQILSVPDFKVIQSLSGHGCAINSIDFTPDGSKMVTGSCDKKGILWEVEGFMKQTTFSASNSIKTIRIASDGKHVAATSGDDNSIFLWTASGTKLAEIGLKQYTGTTPEDHADHVEFSPDGKYFVTQGKGKDLLLFAVSDRKLVSRTRSVDDGEFMHWYKGYLLVLGSDGNHQMYKVSGGGGSTGLVPAGGPGPLDAEAGTRAAQDYDGLGRVQAPRWDRQGFPALLRFFR